MGEHTALGAASGSGRIDDRRDIIFLPHDEIWGAFALEILPAEGTGEIGAQRSFCDQYDFCPDLVEIRVGHDRAPQVVLNHQDLAFECASSWRCSAGLSL